jgi:dTDP-4-dehydrorhamnose reductase
LRRESSSNSPRLLVTGAGGLLGGRLAALLAARMDVIAAVHRSNPPRGLATVPLDLLDPRGLEAALDAARPRAVLHSAAMANIDRCDAEPDLATRVNAEAPAALARLCARRGLRLVALSTDTVFPGTHALSREDDEPRPLMHYASTKLAGERAVLAEHGDAAVARIALVVGRGHGPRGTASEAIAWALRAGRPLRLFTDQYRTPVDPESLAAALATLLEGSQRGVFHLGGAERISRYELGLRVAAALGLSRAALEPARQADAPGLALRPLDASFDSGRARRELGWTPRPLDEALRDGRARPPML